MIRVSVRFKLRIELVLLLLLRFMIRLRVSFKVRCVVGVIEYLYHNLKTLLTEYFHLLSQNCKYRVNGTNRVPLQSEAELRLCRVK